MPYEVEGSDECVWECPQRMTRTGRDEWETNNGRRCVFEKYCDVHWPEATTDNTDGDNSGTDE